MNALSGKSSGTAGYSIVELAISSVLLAMMIGIVSTLSLSGGQAQEYARRLNRVTEITQELIDDMRLELVSSVRLFSRDAEGAANLAMIDLDGAPSPLNGLLLPVVSSNDSIRVDTAGAEITGNSMFFTKLAWSDRFVCASTNEYLVDVYRWVYYYLTPEDGGPDPSHPIGLNIVRVVSEPLIDASSIDRISDADDQAEVLLHLLNGTTDADGMTHDVAEMVWVRGAMPEVSGTFRQIDSANGTLSLTPVYPRPDPFNVARLEQNVTGLLSYRHHSVASNYSQESFGVGRYGLVTQALEGFPHGFEVQVVGPSSARQVLIHMVNSSTQRSGRFAWSEMQVSVDARDL